MLTIPEIAKRTGYSIDYIYTLSATNDFPPPRKYGRSGLRYYAATDIDFWRETHRGYGPNGPRKKRRK